MTRPKPLDLFFAVAWLGVAIWHATDGEVMYGLGFAVLGLVALVAAFVPRVHDFMYRPWREMSRSR